MRLIIIAALSHNRVIGCKGTIPWHLPDDLQHFKRVTTGHTVLMGRKTYQSLGSPLRDRRNVVLSSSRIPEVETYSSLSEALQAVHYEERVFVIGGGEIFRQMLSHADAFMLTLIDHVVDGDTFFPEYRNLLEQSFKLTVREIHKGYEFVEYERQ
ncbi:MAG: dihydrofolate reductase [bacterium]